MHYRALEEKNIEACRNSQKEYIHIISWLEILEFKHEWFSLSILGLNLPKNFINGVMMSAFKDKAFAEIAAHLQLAVLALTLLIWVEVNENDIILASHQKELLIILIDALVSKGKIDEHLLEGPMRVAGFEEPDFTKKYIKAVSLKLFGLNIQFNFKNPS